MNKTTRDSPHPLDAALSRIAGSTASARQTQGQIEGQIEAMRSKALRASRRLRRELSEIPAGPRRDTLEQVYQAAVRNRAMADTMAGIATHLGNGLRG